jgi:hypothetical protein
MSADAPIQEIQVLRGVPANLDTTVPVTYVLASCRDCSWELECWHGEAALAALRDHRRDHHPEV